MSRFIIRYGIDTTDTHYSYNLSDSQLNSLQLIQTYLAGNVVGAPEFSHITAVLKSLHCLKIVERIDYDVLLLTESSTSLKPSYQ